MMEKSLIYYFSISVTVALFLVNSCDSDSRKSNEINSSKRNKGASVLAHDFLSELKGKGTDTIIFYKRTCIGCCDFFNVFWTSNGTQNLKKFYYDQEFRNLSNSTTLSQSNIFRILAENFDELRNTSIKGNAHKNKDGTTFHMSIDHKCYTQIMIYTEHDSIITSPMNDYDFYEFNDSGIILEGRNSQRRTNDNYQENIRSKWNLWLSTIENEIAHMPITTDKEIEALRTR